MRAGRDSRGYTIVEALLFLAISGFMFVIAANFVSGKQTRAEFKQGMNDTNSSVRQVINDVSNGFFPSNSDFSCTATLGSGISFPPTTPNSQGSNTGCVFMGKVIQFQVENDSARPDNTGYNIYTIAGRQFANSVAEGLPPANFGEAKPQAVTAPPAPHDLTDSKTLAWGLRVRKVVSDGVVVAGVGFFGSFANISGGKLVSGSQDVIVVPITPTAPNDKTTFAPHIPSDLTASNIKPQPNITVCLEGGDKQYGTLTIGGSQQRLTTSIQTFNSQSEMAATNPCKT